ncbi:hypothetical protein [Rhodococcus pyridinivorans]|uniref:hypothetical protein n=1 Tax=Rhodococcus pyridinivorans TaxID=103816 RepID=UPI003AAF1AF2
MTSPNPTAAELLDRIREFMPILPLGGTDGQVLTKAGGALAWADPPASGGGGGSITVDPDDSDYLVATGGAIAPDPADPDYLTFA